MYAGVGLSTRNCFPAALAIGTKKSRRAAASGREPSAKCKKPVYLLLLRQPNNIPAPKITNAGGAGMGVAVKIQSDALIFVPG